MRQKGNLRLLMNANLWTEMQVSKMEGGKVREAPTCSVLMEAGRGRTRVGKGRPVCVRVAAAGRGEVDRLTAPGDKEPGRAEGTGAQTCRLGGITARGCSNLGQGMGLQDLRAHTAHACHASSLLQQTSSLLAQRT